MRRSQGRLVGKIELANISVLQRLLASKLVGPKIATLPQLQEKMPDAILKCKTLFKSHKNLQLILQAFLEAKACEGNVWRQFESLLQFLDQCKNKLGKDKKLISPIIVKFLKSLIARNKQNFHVQRVNKSQGLLLLQRDYQQAVLQFFSESKINSQYGAFRLYMHFIYGIKKIDLTQVVLQLFLNTEQRIWKNMTISRSIMSNLFRTLLIILWKSKYCNQIQMLKHYYNQIKTFLELAATENLKFKDLAPMKQFNPKELTDLIEIFQIDCVEQLSKSIKYLCQFEVQFKSLNFFYCEYGKKIQKNFQNELAQLKYIQAIYLNTLLSQLARLNKLREIPRPGMLKILYNFEKNQIVQKLLIKKLPFQCKDLQDFDNRAQQIINKDLNSLAQDLLGYSEKGKDLVPHQLKWILTNYKFERCKFELDQIFRYFSFKSSSSHIISQNFQKLGDVISKTKYIRNIAKVIGILNIKIDPQCEALFKIASKWNEAYQGGEYLEPLSKLSQLLIQKYLEALSVDFIEITMNFINSVIKNEPLFKYIHDNQNLDFQDLLDVIDEVSLEGDSFIKDMIVVKAELQKIFQRITLNEGQATSSLILALSQIFDTISRADFKNLLFVCNHNLDSIKQKIREQIDRTGSTLVKLDMFWNFTEIKVLLTKSGVDVSFQTQQEQKVYISSQLSERKQSVSEFSTKEQTKQEPQVKEERRGLGIDQFSKFIGRSLLLTTQVKGKVNNEKESLRESQALEMKNSFDLVLKIKEALLSLQQSGHFEYQIYSIDEEGSPVQVNQKLGMTLLQLQEAQIYWRAIVLEARKNRYSLTLVAPQYLPKIAKLTKESPEQEIKQFEEIIKNMTNQEIKLVEFLPDKIKECETHDQRLALVGQMLDQIFNNPQYRQIQQNIEGFQELKAMRGLKVFRIKKQNEIWDAILSTFAIFRQLPSFHQILFCTPSTTIHQVELFLSRCEYCCKRSPSIRPIFMMADFQKLSLSIQLAFKERVDEMLQNTKFIDIILLYEAAQEYKVHVIEELKNARMCQILEKSILKKIYESYRQNILIVDSQLAGLGKTQFIHEKITKNHRIVLRIPLYGETQRKDLIETINDRVQSLTGREFQLHFDVSEMHSENLHIILFELLILRKIQIGMKDLAQIPYNTFINIEVANTFNNSLRKSLAYLDGLNSHHRLHKIQPEQIKIPIILNSFWHNALRYLDAMDRKIISSQQSPNEGKPIDKERAQKLLYNYLLQNEPNITYYQIQAFINFLGRQVTLFENSIYLSIKEMKEIQLDQSFRQIVIQNFVALSRNFALQSHVNELTKEDIALQEEELMVRQMKNASLWQNQNAFLLAFNQDGNSLRLFYKNVKFVPAQLQDYFAKIVKKIPQLKKEYSLRDFDSYTEDELREILISLCTKPQHESKVRKTLQKDFKHIALTKDNVIKLAIIYLRVMAGIPLLIVGETGVGKTILIRYLSTLLDAQIKILDVHAGLTQREIAQWVKNQAFPKKEEKDAIVKTNVGDIQLVEDQKEQSKQRVNESSNQKIILFFDEINTNSNVSGILKEVLIDRNLFGRPLPSSVVPIAAANPYKLRKKEVDSLTNGLKIQGLRSSKLVYLVHPLPQSMFTSVWDFGSLRPEDEQKYINKIVQKEWKVAGLNQIIAALQMAQNFVKQKQEVFAVSLRDLARFVKVLNYFGMNGKQGFAPVILAIFFSYYCRFDTQALREEFVTQLKATSFIFNDFEEVKNSALKEISEAIQTENSVAMNQPLKENIFLIVVAIENQIPVILTGPPGSSKTLSARLVYKNMKGIESKSAFFRKKQRLIIVSYQCSELSTSEGIKKVFDRATTYQDSSQSNLQKVVVILDEVGLAEKAQSNPLKVLHRLLEPPKVAMIGLSNWSLDAAKMNRAVHASRPPLTAKDLRETALTMREGINQGVEKDLLFSLSDDFYEYLSELSTGGQFFFHGTRDFYNLISYICREWDNREGAGELGASSVPLVVRGLQRNFGGRNEEDTLGHFSYIGSRVEYKRYLVEPVTLIRENFRDHKSRHLMLITESPEQAFQHLEGLAEEHRQPLKIFYGSDFQEDVTEARAYELIYDVIYCMEQGVSCVFFGLDHIYQSFYDLLNQNYSELQGKKICRIAIGSDNFRAQVHESFKAIVVVKEQDIKIRKYDPPFLNRFEKQRFTFADVFSRDDIAKIQELQKWLELLGDFDDFTEKDLIPSLNPETLSSLIFKFRNHPSIIQACKQALIWLFSFDGAVRASTRDPSILNRFLETQKHRTLKQLYNYVNIQDRLQENQPWVDSFGFRVLFYSPQSLYMQDCDLPIKETKRIELASITSERVLKEELRRFFTSDKYSLLVAVANIQDDSRERILLVKNRINEIRSHFLRERDSVNFKKKMTKKNIFFHIRTVDKYSNGLNPESGWLYVQLQTLNPPQSQLENIDFLMRPARQLINMKFLSDLFESVLSQAVSKIKYSEGALAYQWLRQRFIIYSYLYKIAADQNIFVDWICSEVLTCLESRAGRQRDWFVHAAMNKDLNKTNNQFILTLEQIIREAYAKTLSKFFFIGEKNAVITSFQALEQSPFTKLLTGQILSLWISKTKSVQTALSLTQDNLHLSFPFCKDILAEVSKFKDQFISNSSKELHERITSLQEQSEIGFDKNLRPFTTVQTQIFLYSMSLLSSFGEYNSDIALSIVGQVIKYLSIQKNPGIVGILWEFQEFFQQMQEIWVEMGKHSNKEEIIYSLSGIFEHLEDQENRISDANLQEDEEDKGVELVREESKGDMEDLESKESQVINLLSKQMKAKLIDWTLTKLVNSLLFTEDFYNGLKTKEILWNTQVQFIYTQLCNAIQNQDLQVSEDLMDLLNFLIQIANFLKQGYPFLWSTYKFFSEKSLEERLKDKAGFKQAFDFMLSNSEDQKQIELQSYMLRFALNLNFEPDLVAHSVKFLNHILKQFEPQQRHLQEIDYSKELMEAKRLILIMLKSIDSELLEISQDQNYKVLNRAIEKKSEQIIEPFKVLLADLVQLHFFQPVALFNAIRGKGLSDEVQQFITGSLSFIVTDNIGILPKILGIALFRGLIKLIGHGLQGRQSEEDQRQIRHLLDLLCVEISNLSKEEIIPFALFIEKHFRHYFPQHKQFRKTFVFFDKLSLDEADLEQIKSPRQEQNNEASSLELMRALTSQNKQEISNLMKTPAQKFQTLSCLASNPGIGSPKIISELFNEEFKIIIQRFLDFTQLPKLSPPFITSLLYSMIPAVALDKGFLSSEYFKLESLDDVFLPFMIDSDQNIELDTIFRTESKITKYICTGCDKHVVWVGECGNLNHNHTVSEYKRRYGLEPKCPICKTVIGHEGYNKPISLRRVNKKPVRKADKHQLLEVDPGFQRERPLKEQSVRYNGGLKLRFGRFFSLAQVYFFQKYVIGKQKPKRWIALDEEEILDALKHEWKLMQEISQNSEEELMILVKIMSRQFIKYSQTFQNLALHKKSQEANANRQIFENIFSEKCIPPQKQFSELIRRNNKYESKNFFENLLIEGSAVAEKFPLLMKLQPHVRLQRELNLNLLLIKLAQFKSPESTIWFNLKKDSILFREASDLKDLTLWLKFVHSKLHRKATYNEVQEMTVAEFCEKHKANDLFERMKEVWESYRARNLGVDCAEIYLQDIVMEKCKMAVFCMSDQPDKRGYQTWLLLRFLIESHNACFSKLKSVKDYRPFQIYLQKSTRRVFDLTQSNFFLHLNFERDQEGKFSQEYLKLNKRAQRAGVCDIRNGHGREYYFDYKLITVELLQNYFRKVFLIDTENKAIPLIKFAGEIDLANKIGDIKETIDQDVLPDEIKEQISLKIRSQTMRLKLMEKIDIALTFLQLARSEENTPLLEYCRAFNIEMNKFHLKEFQLELRHIIHLYETLELLVIDELVMKTDPRFQKELNRKQEQGVLKFYNSQREYIDHLTQVLARLCVRNLSSNPRIGENYQLYEQLFDEMQSYIDLWGVKQEQKFQEMQILGWSEHFEIFQPGHPNSVKMSQAHSLYKELNICEEKQQSRIEQQRRVQQEEHERARREEIERSYDTQSIVFSQPEKAKSKPKKKSRTDRRV